LSVLSIFKANKNKRILLLQIYWRNKYIYILRVYYPILLKFSAEAQLF